MFVLNVLYPLQITHGDAAGIGHDIRQNDDSVLHKNFIRRRRDRTIRRFDDELRFYPRGIVPANLLTESGGNEAHRERRERECRIRGEAVLRL